MTQVSLIEVAQKNPCAVFADFLEGLGKTEPDETLVGIPEFVEQAAWATYRQALRDITAQAGFPTDINWTVAPE